MCAARVPEPAEAGGSNPGVIHQEQRVETHAKQEPTQESAQSGDSGEQFLHLKTEELADRITSSNKHIASNFVLSVTLCVF